MEKTRLPDLYGQSIDINQGHRKALSRIFNMSIGKVTPIPTPIVEDTVKREFSKKSIDDLSTFYRITADNMHHYAVQHNARIPLCKAYNDTIKSIDTAERQIRKLLQSRPRSPSGRLKRTIGILTNCLRRPMDRKLPNREYNRIVNIINQCLDDIWLERCTTFREEHEAIDALLDALKDHE